MIKIYTSKKCGQCFELELHLDKLGIEYELVDVNETQEIYDDFVKKTGQSAVPVLEYKDTYFVGYKRDFIDNLFKERQ